MCSPHLSAKDRIDQWFHKHNANSTVRRVIRYLIPAPGSGETRFEKHDASLAQIFQFWMRPHRARHPTDEQSTDEKCVCANGVDNTWFLVFNHTYGVYFKIDSRFCILIRLFFWSCLIETDTKKWSLKNLLSITIILISWNLQNGTFLYTFWVEGIIVVVDYFASLILKPLFVCVLAIQYKLCSTNIENFAPQKSQTV